MATVNFTSNLKRFYPDLTDHYTKTLTLQELLDELNKKYPGIKDYLIDEQNHCGIYKSINGGDKWQYVSEENGIAHFGFTITVDDNDGDTVWVIPCVSDQNRVAVSLKLYVSRTTDGGKKLATF